MLTALEHLGATARGVTSPQLFRADDGRVYVVKLQNNRLGPKVLANELIAARLGVALGLCFPPGGVIK
ncbi:MAG TPA: HipA family kinase, partial [Negativicutes bacterium]|nr:HipA family kinase [Negativicutes bacterium]